MVKVISQETFDAVVKENVEEFGLENDEAVKEAIAQFESQGVNLANIITVAKGDKEFHAVEAALKCLSVDEDLAEEKITEQCSIVRTECSKGLAEKMLATKANGYDILVKIAVKQTRVESVDALTALLQGNPDPFDPNGFSVILQSLDKDNDDSLIASGLALTLAVCVQHEQNRQNLVKNNILDLLDNTFKGHEEDVVRVWIALVQDDDVRVPYGKAHDNARDIVENHNGLGQIVGALKQGLNPTLLLTGLRSLTLRNEYCQSVADQGGLDKMFDLLSDPKPAVLKEALLLLKTLAGNDNLKKEIGTAEKISAIVSIMSNNIANKGICHAGSALIGAICLRMPENAQKVMQAGGAQVLVQVLQTHMATAKVAMASINAMRNVVSRSPELREPLVSLGVEDLLQETLKMHPGAAGDSVKAALRDLGLKVHLKEEWTGTISS